MAKANKHAGETMESLFEGLGERNEVYGGALRRVIAWLLKGARKA